MSIACPVFTFFQKEANSTFDCFDLRRHRGANCKCRLVVDPIDSAGIPVRIADYERVGELVVNFFLACALLLQMAAILPLTKEICTTSVSSSCFSLTLWY